MEDYFNQLFSATSTEWSQVTNYVQGTVTRTHNDIMLVEVEKKEVKLALLNMHLDKSLDPDGMSPGFFPEILEYSENGCS